VSGERARGAPRSSLRQPHPGVRRRKLVALAAAGHGAIATADTILLLPPSAIKSFPAGDLEKVAELLTLLLDADESG
jgi:hypothetical protein